MGKYEENRKRVRIQKAPLLGGPVQSVPSTPAPPGPVTDGDALGHLVRGDPDLNSGIHIPDYAQRGIDAIDEKRYGDAREVLEDIKEETQGVYIPPPAQEEDPEEEDE